jgi:hypothetical protein
VIENMTFGTRNAAYFLIMRNSPTPQSLSRLSIAISSAVLIINFLLRTAASGAAISTGNLVIYRVGDGVAALGTTATAVFLDEYTTGGTLVQSIAAPTSGAGGLTAVGNAATEGILTRSQDGSVLVFGGYRKAVGGTNPSSDAAATTNRVAATLSAGGILTTTVGITDTSGTLRSVASVDGTTQFYLGTSAAVRYVGAPAAASTSVSIDARNSREVMLSGNTLYASNGSTAITGKVQTYGTLPTATTPAVAVSVLATTDAVNGFTLMDLDPTVPGDDTLYAINTVGNTLLKYTYDGTVWTASGSVSAGTASNITGMANGSTANLFLTNGSTLFGFTDASGYNATIAGSLSTLATAGANQGFRGLSSFPVPERSPTALGMLAVGLVMRRRRTSSGR